jgi:predicted ATPase
LAFPAVQLFVDRVSTLIDEFVLTDADAPLVAEICRRLDGLPLAIEFAAARVEVLGIRGLAANLRDSLHLLWGRSRVAMPRHRTIRAVLDWSYGLLTESEKRFFRRLCIFAGTFTIEAASKVTMDVAPPPGGVVNQLADLVMKSLVTADIGGGEPDFRLLETIRAYALEKLDESGEREAVARRHAEYYCDDFERAEAEWKTRPTADWLTDFRRKIDNLRGALDWTFSPKGDVSVGVALTVAAVPLWMQLSLLEECRGRVERALAALEAGPNRDARCEMKLHAALGASLLFTNATIPESGAALTRAREIAESLNDAEYLLQAFAGLFAFHLYNGQSRVALALAEGFSALAATRPNPTDRLTGERLLGVSQHLLGNQLTAQRHFERLLADPATLDRRSSIVRFQIDLEVLARVYLAWTLWLRGFPDQAIRAAGSSVEDARAADHALSHCFALARVACPIALLVGDLAAAEHYSEMLLDLSIRHALAHFCAIGRCQQGVLAIMRGAVATGLPLLRFGMNERTRSPSLRLMTFLMAEALGRTGQIVDGLATIEAALSWTERSEDHWAIAELLRVKGELLLLQGAPSAAAAAEDYCRQALDWAGRQGALSWELRATTSLARLWRDQGRSADALALLGPIYGRFTEGFDTTDLAGAKRLLDELNDLRRN